MVENVNIWGRKQQNKEEKLQRPSEQHSPSHFDYADSDDAR